MVIESSLPVSELVQLLGSVGSLSLLIMSLVFFSVLCPSLAASSICQLNQYLMLFSSTKFNRAVPCTLEANLVVIGPPNCWERGG
jgi:hypothetical protein